MSDFVTYVEADFTPAEVVTLVVRTKARVAAQSSAFCGDLSSTTWFPVAPGTTLPSPPAATTNASPAPANSVPLPSGLDPNDTCYIFQDLLPVTSAPVYAEELEPVAVLPPYIEELPLLGITVAGISVVEWPYALTLPASSVEAVTRSVINIPTYNETLEAGAYALNGQDAAVVRRYTLVGAAGSYALAGQAADFVRGYVVAGNAGTYAINGQDAGLVYQRLPMALDAGSYALTGQDASLFKGITMVADAGSYTLSGQDAEKIRGYVVAGDAGTYVLTGQISDLVRGGAPFANVSLLLHFNGTNNSTVFTDNSSVIHAITAFGDAKISTAESKFGGSSALFDGNGDYLRAPNNTSSLDISGDFTLETWIYMNSYKDGVIMSSSASTQNNAQLLRVNNNGNGTMLVYLDNNAGALGVLIEVNALNTVVVNTWHHIALSRTSGTARLFVDGVQKGIKTSWTTGFRVDCFGTLFNSGTLNTALYFDGYMDDLRITKSTGRYTTNFTPPTAAFADL